MYLIIIMHIIIIIIFKSNGRYEKIPIFKINVTSVIVRRYLLNFDNFQNFTCYNKIFPIQKVYFIVLKQKKLLFDNSIKTKKRSKFFFKQQILSLLCKIKKIKI